ncbi:MAG: hypothetical protein JW731_17920 [Bacteroidales bacterium]|nr:hypothetical protein [Bacteroidales bacterium]
MKTFTGILLLAVMTILTACEGEPGPPGRDGIDGESFLGSVFEIEGDFIPENEYSLYFEFPESLIVYESDVVLVYILWEQAEDNSGELLDVWRLLPQTVVLEEGILQYSYDHTFLDVRIFLDGTLDFSTLRVSEAYDQIFRIVVLPADYAIAGTPEVSEFDLLMKSLNVKPEVIRLPGLTE